MKMNNVNRIVVGTTLILLVPLVAMIFTDEVKWGLFDFIIIGTLLVGASLTFEFVTARLNPKYRASVAFVFVAMVLLIWVELAAGIFNSPLAGS